MRTRLDVGGDRRREGEGAVGGRDRRAEGAHRRVELEQDLATGGDPLPGERNLVAGLVDAVAVEGEAPGPGGLRR